MHTEEPSTCVLAKKILNFLKRWLANLRRAFVGVEAQSAEAKAMLAHMDELQALWNRGLATAVDTYRRTNENTAEDGGVVQYEVRETKNVKKRSYDRWDVEAALWDALDHQDDGKENLIFVGGMPRFVVDKLGIEGDFYIYRDHAYENMVSKNRAVQEGRYEAKAHYHDLGVEVMTDAIMALEDPIASVATKTKDGNPAIISILPIMGKNNAPLYAVMSFYSKKSINGDFSRKPHVILTVAERALEEEGGRVGTIRIVNDAVKDGKILFYDKKKRDYLSVKPETISLSVVTEQSLERNIARFRAEVNAFKKRNKIYYSAREVDSEGRRLSAQQQEYFADSVVRDADGRLKVVYHGSTAIFTEFSLSFMGRHGSAEGQGIYFTDSKTMAEGYQNADGQLMEGYLLISKPLSDSKLTLTRGEVRKLLAAMDPTGDDIIINFDPSGMGYPSRAWYNRAMNAALDMLMDGNDTDTELMGEIANINGDTAPVLRMAREVLGYDGYIVEGKYEDATVYVAFESNQFKNRDNTTPTKSGDIRFSARDTTTITDREILAHTLDSAAQTQAEKTLLERYRAHAEELWGQARTWERKYKEQTLSSPCEERVCLFFQIDFPFGKVIEGIGCGGNRIFHRAGGQQQRVALETDGQDRTLALQLGT